MAKLTFNAILGDLYRQYLPLPHWGNGCCAGCFPLPGSIQRERVASEGRTADSQATEIAAERGTLLEGHVARRLTPPWCATTI